MSQLECSLGSPSELGFEFLLVYLLVSQLEYLSVFQYSLASEYLSEFHSVYL